MNEKLRILLQSENLTASRLAEILEIKPAAVSHILSGRNKPSFDLLCKIVNRFPHINPYWLLGDAQEMRNANMPNSTEVQHGTSGGTLFDQVEGTTSKSENLDIYQFSDNKPSRTSGSANIEKIIVVYSDHSFEELTPKKN